MNTRTDTKETYFRTNKNLKPLFLDGKCCTADAGWQKAVSLDPLHGGGEAGCENEPRGSGYGGQELEQTSASICQNSSCSSFKVGQHLSLFDEKSTDLTDKRWVPFRAHFAKISSINMRIWSRRQRVNPKKSAYCKGENQIRSENFRNFFPGANWVK